MGTGIKRGVGETPEECFRDIEAIALFLKELNRATGREFIVGIGDTVTGISEDLFSVGSRPLDLNSLREALG